MNDKRATVDQLALLSSLSTCELADALIKLKHPTGGYVPDLERYSGMEGERLVGEVFTIEMVDSQDLEAPKLEGHFVDLAEPGTMVFISTPVDAKSASLGGLLATALQAKGVKGCITCGRCRDLDELNDLGFPVYARGHSALGQFPFTRVSRVQVPLSIPPVSTSPSSDFPAFPPTEVHPFDIAVADRDGVVVIQPAVLDDVLRLAAEGRAVDERCRVDLLAGKGVAETFKLHRGK
ncbi:hypothetical protein JCM11641_000623 [Rhodosporidiobolus odoratus]